jgi:hypothetical protein
VYPCSVKEAIRTCLNSEGRRRYEFRFVLCTFASKAGCVDENDARKKERKKERKKNPCSCGLYFDDLIRYFEIVYQVDLYDDAVVRYDQNFL